MTAESDPQRAGLTNPAPRFSALLGCCSLLAGCRISHADSVATKHSILVYRRHGILSR
jgi:hypothetical protein